MASPPASQPQDSTGAPPRRWRRPSGTTTAVTVPPLNLLPTTLPVITPPPGAPPSTQPVTTTSSTTLPTKPCLAAPAPPATAKNLQSMPGDFDGDGAGDTLDLRPTRRPPPPDPQRSRCDRLVLLPYGKLAVAVGFIQVDYALGTAAPGTEQEIMAVTAQPDGTRLVGVFTFAKNTGCLELFHFAAGAPFVYLVSRTGDVSGLHCTNDGLSGHLEAVTATRMTPSTYRTSRLVFGRVGHGLQVVQQASGTLTLPKDQAALATDGDVTDCLISRPLF